MTMIMKTGERKALQENGRYTRRKKEIDERVKDLKSKDM